MNDSLSYGVVKILMALTIVSGLLWLLVGIMCHIKKKEGWKKEGTLGKVHIIWFIALPSVPLILLITFAINSSIYYFGGEFEEKQETFEAYMSNGYKIIAKFEENGYFSMPSTYSCEDPDSVIFLDSDYKTAEPQESSLVLCK